jgi:gluconolactonase
MKPNQRSIGIGISGRIGLGLGAAIMALCALPVLAQTPAGIPGVLAPGAATQLVQEGFTFTEGPVGTADGGLDFTDIPPNRIYHLDPAGKISVLLEGSNGANGLALTKDGDLVFVEGSGKRVAKRAKDGTITVLTEGAPGMPLMAPNDLILDAKGDVYFTDPGPFPPVPGRTAYVYYLPVGSKAAVVIDNQNPLPNGLVLTNDGKTLIVNDTLGTTVWAFDVKPDGSVANKHAFATLQGTPAGRPSGADGMAIDRDDRVYVATVTGVQVFDAKGKYLGTIPIPRQPTNVAFAGPGKQTLYITARQGLYRINTLTKGPDRLGK